MSKRSKDRIVVKAIIEGNGKTRSQVVGYVARITGACGEVHESPILPKANHAKHNVRQIASECPNCIAKRSLLSQPQPATA